MFDAHPHQSSFSGEGGTQLSSNLYFLLASILCVFCIIVHCFLLPSSPAVVEDTTGQLENLVHHSVGMSDDSEQNEETVAPFGTIDLESISPGRIDKENQESRRYFRIAFDIRKPMLALVLCYVVTLSIFPGVITEDLDEDSKKGSWYPLLLIFFFNLADFCGKCIPRSWQVPFFHENLTVLMALLRMIFIPVFLALGTILTTFLIFAATFMCSPSQGSESTFQSSLQLHMVELSPFSSLRSYWVSLMAL